MHKKTEVKQATLKYFKGDELATNVWMTKYAAGFRPNSQESSRCSTASAPFLKKRFMNI